MDKVYLVKARFNDFEWVYEKVLGVFTDPVLAATFRIGYEKKMLEFKHTPLPAQLEERPSDEWTVEDHLTYDKWLLQHDMGCGFNSIWLVDDDNYVLNPDLEKIFL